MDIIVTGSLRDVDAPAWNALIGHDNPFLEHAFLLLLEDSGSVGVEAGWVPHYLLVKDGDEVVGATFAYLKDHSYGEYIFDWQWANAAGQAGIAYYPKLVVAVPFTPATGPRLLAKPGADRDRVWRALLAGLEEVRKLTEAESVHFLYCMDDEAAFLAEQGYARRATYQFHWRNNGYQSFEAFLADLRAPVRKQVKRERRRVVESGVEVTLHRGDEVESEDWKTMRRLYLNTSGRKWGSPYLAPTWFDSARETVGPLAQVCFARREGRIVAGTLSFERGQHLYGRYWGAFERIDGLHFELCYYRLIEHAIDTKLALVEAGAQGEHKVKRGYLPCITHSAHRFAHAGFGRAVGELLGREREGLEREIAAWQAEGPFREETVPPFPPVAGIALPPIE